VNAVDALGTIPLISACRNGSQHNQAFKSIIAVCVRLSTLESLIALWHSTPCVWWGGLLQELIDAGSLTDHKNLLGEPSPLIPHIRSRMHIIASHARVLALCFALLFGRRDSPEPGGGVVGA